METLESGGYGGSPLSRPLSGHPPRGLCLRLSAREPGVPAPPGPPVPGLGRIAPPTAPSLRLLRAAGLRDRGREALESWVGLRSLPGSGGQCLALKGISDLRRVGRVAAPGRGAGFLAGAGLGAAGGAAPQETSAVRVAVVSGILGGCAPPGRESPCEIEETPLPARRSSS